MEEEYGGNRIAIDSGKGVRLALRNVDDTTDQGKEEKQDDEAADEALFLANGAEDEVRRLLRYIGELGLSPLEVTFAREATRADRNKALMDIIPRRSRV